MRIAVDAMGGDFAPAEIVEGVLQGCRLHEVDAVLVGDEHKIRRFLSAASDNSARISVRHASEVIGMDESVDAVRTKKDASVVVAASMVATGDADAMVSMGNTAAAMAIATLKLGRIEGIDRPAIATVWPGRAGPTIVLDAGAVADCTVENLKQFAIMGAIYAEKVLSIARPRIALLSIGEEKCKGNELIRAANEALSEMPINFVGNIEGQHLLSSAADVVVTDGFTGNVALKAAEGIVEHVIHLVQEDIRTHPLNRIPILFLMPLIRRVKRRLDYSEYGGAPLLGVNGVCIIGHGRSNARAVANAVRAAKEAVSGGVVEAIRGALATQATQAL
ncbi:MAG: phosphate acyltransferase PlsX [Armatimonadetes bacterium]|nr:phosphate acyltransferase PlsX [Armatimonadota bacterium]